MTHINAYFEEYETKKRLADDAAAAKEAALADLRSHPDFKPELDPEAPPAKDAKK
jgi:hypothetical protein